MTADISDELAILWRLDELVRAPPVRAVLDPLVESVEARLNLHPTASMAWEPVPLIVYGTGLPMVIQSSWVFVLRGNCASGAERHPNSHQRVLSYRGVGDLQVRPGQHWESHYLTDDLQAPLLSRWASIPPLTWHQAVVSGAHWGVVSFHTVAPQDLVEERPDPSDDTGTRQRHYLDLGPDDSFSDLQ